MLPMAGKSNRLVLIFLVYFGFDKQLTTSQTSIHHQGDEFRRSHASSPESIDSIQTAVSAKAAPKP